MRPDGRAFDELRPITFERNFTKFAGGSVLASCGDTRVLCTAMVSEDVPRWMKGTGTGWVTAEYSMLPGSSSERIRRERNGAKGRTQEIERLIGRSLRAIVDLGKLGERQIQVDCDVLQADGGTRTTSISASWLALWDACAGLVAAGTIKANPITDYLAAVSVGVVGGEAVLDLPYVEDSSADVDMNIVGTGKGLLVEIQGTAEGATFDRPMLDSLIDLGLGGIQSIVSLQSGLVEATF